METLRKRISGLEDIILQEIECRAVDRIAPRLCGHADDRPARLRKLGVIVARGDARLGHRIDRRIHHHNAENGVVIVHTVQQIVGPCKLLAVRVHECGLLRIFAWRVLERVDGRARHKQRQICKIAIEHRQLGDLLAAKSRRDFGAVRLDARGRLTHGHLLSRGAQQKLCVDSCGHPDSHRDALLYESPEPALVNGHPVSAGRELCLCKISGVVCICVENRSFVYIRDRHSGVRDNRARLVSGGANDVTVDRLRLQIPSRSRQQ